ncbi:hypothetical protein DY000_02008975, partial [Brassica cretica]
MHGLISYRRFGRARSLRSDRAERTLGRYVATELGPSSLRTIGRYVATELGWISVTTDQLAVDDCLEKETSGWFIDTDDDGTWRPPGVKAAKAHGKKPVVEGKDLCDFQAMWSIKKEDLAMKEKLSKMKLLESLVAKQVMGKKRLHWRGASLAIVII